MDAGINDVIYMELHWGPKMANGTCGNDRARFHCVRCKRKASSFLLNCCIFFLAFSVNLAILRTSGLQN